MLSISAVSCRRPRPALLTARRSPRPVVATLVPPLIPVTAFASRFVSLLGAALTACPESLSCVVAPLVLGSALVYQGFQSYALKKTHATSSPIIRDHSKLAAKEQSFRQIH